MKKKTIVYAQNVTKIFGEVGDTQVTALSEVNLDIQEGEFVSVMGPSGSGKTTLMNMIGMLDRPTKGQIKIAGVDTTQIKERRLFKLRRENIGFIFQKFYLIPTLTALDNVLAPLIPLGIKKDDRERAKQVMEDVGLGDRMTHLPHQLSGGQLQRVAIARALVMNPPVILADEPTGNLDSVTGAEIFKLMKRLNKKKGTTFIIVTHDPRIAKATERTIYLKDGKTYTDPTVALDVIF